MLVATYMQAAMHAKAGEIADNARAISPVGPMTDSERQHYIESFTVSSGVRDTPTRRAYGEVSNDSEHAAAVEYGNGRTSPKTIDAHHVLGRAIEAARE
jgi:hypothetical protein